MDGDSRYQRYGSLAFLTIQNSALILTLSYSRKLPGPQFLPATAVLLSETIKVVLSLTVWLAACVSARAKFVRNWETNSSTFHSFDTPKKYAKLGENTFSTLRNLHQLLMLMLPSLLYTIQNNLQILAITNLDAATYQVVYQGKILTTAVCSVLLLKKKLNMDQMSSIVLLTLSITWATFPTTPTNKSTHHNQNYALGIATVSVACLLSGIAGVYTESVLKKAQYAISENPMQSFWLRNLQLSTISVVFAASGLVLVDRHQLVMHGFFYGYRFWVWVAVFLQAIGGIAVAFVITYTDNILKGFATSMSIVMSTIISAVFWDFQITLKFVFGVLGVLIAVLLYGRASKPMENSSRGCSSVRCNRLGCQYLHVENEKPETDQKTHYLDV